MSGEAGRLRWRCRRGHKELDLLLSTYLERDYAHAGAPLQRAFETLLEWPDPDLLQLLLGNMATDDQHLAKLVEQIRRASES